MTASVECGNEEHELRAAVAVVTWPSGRFHSARACRECLDDLLACYVLPSTDLVDGPYPVQKEPVP